MVRDICCVVLRAISATVQFCCMCVCVLRRASDCYFLFFFLFILANSFITKIKHTTQHWKYLSVAFKLIDRAMTIFLLYKKAADGITVDITSMQCAKILFILIAIYIIWKVFEMCSKMTKKEMERAPTFQLFSYNSLRGVIPIKNCQKWQPNLDINWCSLRKSLI